MELYGIFNKLDNYKLLRYSATEQSNKIYKVISPNTKQEEQIEEVCLPDIKYNENFIGRHYNIEINEFL